MVDGDGSGSRCRPGDGLGDLACCRALSSQPDRGMGGRGHG